MLSSTEICIIIAKKKRARKRFKCELHCQWGEGTISVTSTVWMLCECYEYTHTAHTLAHTLIICVVRLTVSQKNKNIGRAIAIAMGWRWPSCACARRRKQERKGAGGERERESRMGTAGGSTWGAGPDPKTGNLTISFECLRLCEYVSVCEVYECMCVWVYVWLYIYVCVSLCLSTRLWAKNKLNDVCTRLRRVNKMTKKTQHSHSIITHTGTLTHIFTLAFTLVLTLALVFWRH